MNTRKEHVQLIFNKLIEARGDASKRKPELDWREEAKYGAFYDPGTNRITFEGKTYDVCLQFGAQADQAIAYVLAHELIHYYKGHGWEAAFANEQLQQNENLAREVAGQTETIQLHDRLQEETESDVLGGFLAYTAGYDTLDIAATFLPELYKAYGWKEAIAGYPSLQERIRLAHVSRQKLQDLIQVFETGNCLVALERYQDATALYNHIMAAYRSRELVNNLGVVYCMEAMNYFPNGLAYAFPLELDAEARLSLESKSGPPLGKEKETRDQLLYAAIGCFEEAKRLDSDYLVARLNLGCAYALMALSQEDENGVEAQEYYDFAALYAAQTLRRAKTLEHNKLHADLKTLQGIIELKKNNREAASQLFAEAKEESPAARINAALLTNQSIAANDIPLSWSQNPVKEQIESIDLEEKIKNFSLEPGAVTFKIEGKYWGMVPLKQSKILFLFIKSKNYAYIHLTTPEYTGGTARGIRLGDSLENIQAKYLKPDREITLPKGHLLVYEMDKILFWLNQSGKLERWGVYVKEPK